MPATEPRLWLQVTPRRAPLVPEFAGAEIAASVAATLIASGLSFIATKVVDLAAPAAAFRIETTLAHQPAFGPAPLSGAAQLLPTCITLNVGPEPVALWDTDGRLLQWRAIADSEVYKASPVFLQLLHVPSEDGSALAGQVNLWKYEHFLGPNPLHSRRHVRITIEVFRPDGSRILDSTIRFAATPSTLSQVKLDGTMLPWRPLPLALTPPRNTDPDGRFGPINLAASITESVRPA